MSSAVVDRKVRHAEFGIPNMKRTQTLVIAAFTVCAIAFVTFAAAGTEEEADPVFGIKIYPGYRDWRFISVAREDGILNDLRVVLGNDIAIKAYREGMLPFPDGSVLARIAWKSTPSEENNKVFGHVQSFVPGEAPEWYLQFMVKDSKKYAATGGWGFAQFTKDGKPADLAKHQTCFSCHEPIKARDFVFTQYAH